MFSTLEAVAAAIARVEGWDGQMLLLSKMAQRVRQIEAYAKLDCCHGEVFYGNGGMHRFCVKGTQERGYLVVLLRRSTDASIIDPKDKGWMSRPAIERAEAMGINVV